MKNVFFISSKKPFLFSKYSDFCISVFPSFSPVSHSFRGWSKINLKVYDIINCLNKILITYFVWYLGKEKRYDIEPLSIDRVLNKQHFYEMLCRKCAPKPSPRTLFNFVNNLKQPLHARNYFKNKVFWKRIIKKPWKS